MNTQTFPNQLIGPWIEAEEAAKYVGCCKKTMERYAREGLVKFGRLGKKYKFKQQWLDDMLINNGNRK